MDAGGLRKWSVSLNGSSAENLKGGGPPLGTLMDMYRKALERAIFLHRGPVGGHGRDAPLPGL